MMNLISFLQLCYSKSFIQCAIIKALEIHKHKCSPKIPNNNFSNNNLLHRYIILPNDSITCIKKTTLELKQLLSLQRQLGINKIIKTTIPTSIP